MAHGLVLQGLEGPGGQTLWLPCPILDGKADSSGVSGPAAGGSLYKALRCSCRAHGGQASARLGGHREQMGGGVGLPHGARDPKMFVSP